jgi:cyclopropane fatty-acyl-phospholipid synthase-like methyltransferase
MNEWRNRLPQQARDLYRQTAAPGRWIQSMRPHICPFDQLIDHIPDGARVLDVGCGSGLFLGLLAVNDRITHGVGFDASNPALRCGEHMLEALPSEQAARLHLEHCDARAAWPAGVFDAVTMIDVMHHVPPAAQEGVFARAAAKLAPGGRLVYKDMAQRPAWSALANRLHDLVMAREWIHYRPVTDVEKWGHALGLSLLDRGVRRMYWYTHEWLIFEKP